VQNAVFLGKTWWITGASSGIGAALSDAISVAGADLILSDRNEGALREAATRCRTQTRVLRFEATVLSS
jgi:short-subunit dehydrogenase